MSLPAMPGRIRMRCSAFAILPRSCRLTRRSTPVMPMFMAQIPVVLTRCALTPTAGVGNDLWERLYCHQGFVVALPLRNGATGPEGVLISYERPMRSIRTIERPEGQLLQVAGGSYVENPNAGAEPYDDLEAWARQHFDVGAAQFRWTTQDYSTADSIPLIGSLADEGLYIATGFGGWGLTTAGVAGAIIRDLIT